MAQSAAMIKGAKYTPRQKKVRRRVLIGKIIFYLFLFAYIAIFLHAAKYGYGLLMDWLAQLEASQPDKSSQKVFDELFADPDWIELYHLAGEEDTIYEGAQAYATYMDNLVGDQELTYVETSAGLSGDKKYIVRLGDAKIAEFTLTNVAPENETIPDWVLDKVFVYYTRQESLTVFTVPGHTVYINGVALNTEDHIVSKTDTVVEQYLPEGLHGYQDMTLYFEGLLVQPEVTIQDENGEFMEVQYDPKTNHYTEVLPQRETVSEEFQEFLINAAQAYGRHMINAPNPNLKAYFDTNGQAYQAIIAFEKWTVQDFVGYEFTDTIISDYYRYDHTFFSARVSMMLNVTYRSPFTGQNTVTSYTIDTTFFARQNEQGSWLIESMTNVDVQVATTMVKLVYKNGDKVIHTEWVDANSRHIILPEIQVPNGKVLTGWYTKTVDGMYITYSLVFSATEDNVVILPSGYELRPMVLYAQFAKEDTP